MVEGRVEDRRKEILEKREGKDRERAKWGKGHGKSWKC